jgi:protein gp37
MNRYQRMLFVRFCYGAGFKNAKPPRALPAIVRFISYEPAIGPLLPRVGIKSDWPICGGETGGNARIMNPDWARQVRDACKLE